MGLPHSSALRNRSWRALGTIQGTRIKQGSAACRANALPAVLWPRPRGRLFRRAKRERPQVTDFSGKALPARSPHPHPPRALSHQQLSPLLPALFLASTAEDTFSPLALYPCLARRPSLTPQGNTQPYQCVHEPFRLLSWGHTHLNYAYRSLPFSSVSRAHLENETFPIGVSVFRVQSDGTASRHLPHSAIPHPSVFHGPQAPAGVIAEHRARSNALSIAGFGQQGIRHCHSHPVSH